MNNTPASRESEKQCVQVVTLVLGVILMLAAGVIGFAFGSVLRG